MTAEEQSTIRTIAEHLLVNGREAAEAVVQGRQIPPLHLKSGLILYHGSDDPIVALMGEIFHHNVYCGNGFYAPMPGDIVVDCGANIGVFMLYLISLERNVRVFCFEPSARTRKRLRQNVRANGLTNNVFIEPYALYSAEVVMNLKPTGSSGDKSFFHRNNILADQPEEKVRCIGLPAALERCGVDRLDLLKLDVEGAELEILEGASHMDWNRIRRIVLEYHNFIRPNCGRQVYSMLRGYGYDAIEFGDEPECGIIRAQRTSRERIRGF